MNKEKKQFPLKCNHRVQQIPNKKLLATLSILFASTFSFITVVPDILYAFSPGNALRHVNISHLFSAVILRSCPHAVKLCLTFHFYLSILLLLLLLFFLSLFLFYHFSNYHNIYSVHTFTLSTHKYNSQYIVYSTRLNSKREQKKIHKQEEHSSFISSCLEATFFYNTD